MKKNEHLQKDVQEALKYEPLLHAAEIGVTVHDSVVTLTGCVDNNQKRIAAEKAAAQVKGVRAVVEKIEVITKDHTGKTDEEIAQQLIHVLKWTWNIPDDKIMIKVEAGWVWLEGTLEWENQRKQTQHIAQNIPGVKGVTNNILLKSEKKDKVEKEKIQEAFSGNWNIDATNIAVKVDHNKVTLSGWVDSLYERGQAARIAWNTPGVTEVENKIVVEFADDIY